MRFILSFIKKNERIFNRLIVFFIFGMTGGLLGYLLGRYILPADISIGYPPYYKAILITLIIITILLAVAIHEIGHVIAGRLVNFKFRMFVVGPFLWEKEEDKIIFKWNRNLNIFGGLSLCLPTNDSNLKYRFIKYIAGGPVVSLLFSILMLGIFYAGFLPEEESIWMYITSHFFHFSGLISSFIFIGTILPVASGGFHSDGSRILKLLLGGRKAEADMILINTIAFSSGGIRPKNLDNLKLKHIINSSVGIDYKVHSFYYLYLHYFDKQDFSEANRFIQLLIEHIQVFPSAYQPAIWLEATFFEGFVNKNPETARYYYKKVKKSAITPKADIYKAEAAILLAEGKYDRAIKKAGIAKKYLPRLMEKGLIKAYAEWLIYLIKEGEKKMKEIN